MWDAIVCDTQQVVYTPVDLPRLNDQTDLELASSGTENNNRDPQQHFLTVMIENN